MKVYISSLVNVYDTGETVAFAMGSQDTFRKADIRCSVIGLKQRGYWEKFAKQYPRMADVFECMLKDDVSVSRLYRSTNF